MNNLIKLSRKQKLELRSICKEYNLSNKWLNCFTTKLRYLTLFQTYEQIVKIIKDYFKKGIHYNIFLFSHYIDSKCSNNEVLSQIKKEIPSRFLF